MITVWERGRKESGEEMRFKLGLGFAVLSEGKRKTRGVKWQDGIGGACDLTEETRGGREVVGEGARKAGTKGPKGLHVKLRDLYLPYIQSRKSCH